MTEDAKRRSPRRGGHAARTIFQIMMGGSERKPGFTIENEATLIHGRGRAILGREPDRRGFPAYPEPPRLLIDPKAGRPPSDWEYCGEFKLISDKLKTVLDALDPDGCTFLKCDVRNARGEVTGGYWLMDVVRVLDAIDESASDLIIRYDDRLAAGKAYMITGGRIVFKRDVIGTAHIFELRFAEGSIFCDGELKNACRRAGIRGMSFDKAGEV
jgi:hypothetical protein